MLFLVFTLQETQEYGNGLKWVDNRQQYREQAEKMDYRRSQRSTH